MRQYTLSHLSDATLLRELATLVAQDRLATAALLAHIAEVDARKLYVPEGYSSMHEFCVSALKLSEDAAFSRIRAARVARHYPAIFDMVADGRLHVTGICVLAPYLTAENADELLQAAEGRRKTEIEELLARRSSRREVLPVLRGCQIGSGQPDECDTQLVPERVEVSSNTDAVLTSVVDAEAVPTPERYPLRLLVDKSTHEKLRYAQALLSHAVPSGDVARVLDRALDALIEHLERRKFGGARRSASREPREGRAAVGRQGDVVPRRLTGSAGSGITTRYIPAHVRRAVWERDQGRCTFVSAGGHRCDARRFLEFDHVHPVARGGRATVEGVRLRCRAHNQFEAERAFGKGFMEEKRREAAAGREVTQDLIAALRGLGCRTQEARRAAEVTEALGRASLEERLRAALSYLSHRGPRGGCAVSLPPAPAGTSPSSTHPSPAP